MYTIKKCFVYIYSISPKPHIDRMSMLRSVHIFKKQQTQYEQRTFFRVFNVSICFSCKSSKCWFVFKSIYSNSQYL